jgi:hypothetical protein
MCFSVHFYDAVLVLFCHRTGLLRELFGIFHRTSRFLEKPLWRILPVEHCHIILDDTVPFRINFQQGVNQAKNCHTAITWYSNTGLGVTNHLYSTHPYSQHHGIQRAIPIRSYLFGFFCDVDEITVETKRTNSETSEYRIGKDAGRSDHSLTRGPDPTRAVPRAIQRTQSAFGPGYEPRHFRIRTKDAASLTGIFYLQTRVHACEEATGFLASDN